MKDVPIVRPSWWYCSFGAVAILAGVSLFLYTIIQGLSHITDDLTQIVVPGEKDLTLMSKVNYTIFLEERSVVDGRIFSTTESLSGLTCAVTSRTSGNKIDLRSSTINTTYSVGGREGKSVLEFATQEAGVYHTACNYEEGSRGPQAVIAVGSGLQARIFTTVIKSLASFFGGGLLGAVIIAIVAILRARSRKQLAQRNQALGH